MKKHRRIALGLAIVAALSVAFTYGAIGAGATPAVVATPSARGQQVTLVFKYQAGDEHVFEQTMSQDVEIQGVQSVGGTDINQTMRWKVLEVADNGDATIEVTTDRVHGTIANPMGTTSFDSASDEAPPDPTTRILAAQAGISFRFVLTPSGELVSIEGAEEMRKLALEAMPEDQRGFAASIVDEMFNDEAMENMLRQGFQSFPTEPVGPGDSWDRSMSMKLPMIGTMTTAMTMTLDRVERRDGATIAVIAWTGTMELTPDAGGGFPGTIHLSSADMTGTSEFDVDRGLVLANTMSSVMQMAVSAAGQEMVMNMNMNMNVKLVEGGQ